MSTQPPILLHKSLPPHTNHYPLADSSRYFGATVLVVTVIIFFLYWSIPCISLECGSLYERLLDMTKLLMKVDVAKAKV